MSPLDFLFPAAAPSHELLRTGAMLVLKSTLVLTVALLLSAALSRRSAALRHFVLALGMAAALAVPLIALVSPPLELPLLPATTRPAAQTFVRTDTGLSAPESPPASGAPAPAVERATAPAPSETGIDWTLAAGTAVVGFSLLSVLYLGAGVLLVVRLDRRSTPLDDDAEWQRLLDALHHRLELRRPVRLRVSHEVAVPLTLGWRRPAVILPAESPEWAEDERRAVLLHELAHVARRDWPVQLLARLAVSLHWFNPLAWIACRRLLDEAERACDDVVLAGGGNGPSYARQLLELATRSAKEPPAFAAVAMARRATLSQRIQAILDPGQRRAGLARRQTAALGCTALALLLVVAPARLVRGEDTNAGDDGLLAMTDGDVHAEATIVADVEADLDLEDLGLDATALAAEAWAGGASDALPPLLGAAYRRDAAAVRAALAAGADPDEGVEALGTPLIVAATQGDLDTVRILLDAGASATSTQQRRNGGTLPRSPLGAAAHSGVPAIVELLLDAGADPDLAPRGDATPLMIAAERGHDAVVGRLLAAGAYVQVALKGDGTALIAAARGAHLDVVERLLAAGADPNVVVRGDGSPLIAAVQRGDERLVGALLAADADPDRWVDGDESPLFHAVASGQTEMVRMLLAGGADPNAVWPGDGNPLTVAARTGDDELTSLLLEAGARADAGVEGDGNALIVAAGEGRTALLATLLEDGADPDASVRGDGSPLIAAARGGHLAAAELLVRAGADVDLVVPGDENPLIQAAGYGHYDLVRYLLDVGADPNVSVTVTRFDGRSEVRSPLALAQREGHREIVELLLARGATP